MKLQLNITVIDFSFWIFRTEKYSDWCIKNTSSSSIETHKLLLLHWSKLYFNSTELSTVIGLHIFFTPKIEYFFLSLKKISYIHHLLNCPIIFFNEIWMKRPLWHTLCIRGKMISDWTRTRILSVISLSTRIQQAIRLTVRQPMQCYCTFNIMLMNTSCMNTTKVVWIQGTTASIRLPIDCEVENVHCIVLWMIH